LFLNFVPIKNIFNFGENFEQVLFLKKRW